jgi:hypothetical protein
MKNKELIEKALAELSYVNSDTSRKTIESCIHEAKKLINNFLISQSVASVRKFDLSKFCDIHTPRFSGIYHDAKGYKVASNSYILAAIKADITEEHKNKIITTKGEYVDAIFPNWRAISSIEYKKEVSFADPIKIVSLIKEAKPLAKANRNKKIIVKYKWNEDNFVVFDASYLELFCSFLKAFPTVKVYAEIQDNERSVIAKNEEGNICIMMPIKAKSIDYIIEYNVE